MGYKPATVAAEDEDEDRTVVLSRILDCHRYFLVAVVTVIVEEQSSSV